MKPGENADFYCNHHQFSACNCSALETQLVECSKILVVCIQRSPAGNFKRYIIYHSAFQSVFKNWSKNMKHNSLLNTKQIELRCMLLIRFEILCSLFWIVSLNMYNYLLSMFMTCPFIDSFLQRTNLGNLCLRIVSVHNVQTFMQTFTYNFTEDKMFVTKLSYFCKSTYFFFIWPKMV